MGQAQSGTIRQKTRQPQPRLKFNGFLEVILGASEIALLLQQCSQIIMRLGITRVE